MKTRCFVLVFGCCLAVATAACGKSDKGKPTEVPTAPPTPAADAQAEPPPVTPPVATKPLFERLGGLSAISVVVDDFIDVLVADDLLNKNPKIKEARDKVPAPYIKHHLTAMVCQVTGGPCVYTGRNMKDSHAHLAITEAEWGQLAKLFKATLDKYKVPDKEQQELFEIIGTTKADIVTVK